MASRWPNDIGSKSLDDNREAIEAFDSLMRLMRDRAGRIRAYAHAVANAYGRFAPVLPALDRPLGQGKVDALWDLWFFTCEMPKRLCQTVLRLDRLLYAGMNFMPRPLTVNGFQVITARFIIIVGLRGLGHDISSICEILDPVGYEANPKASRDRIRKEVERIRAATRRGHAQRQTGRDEARALLVEPPDNGAGEASRPRRRRSN